MKPRFNPAVPDSPLVRRPRKVVSPERVAELRARLEERGLLGLVQQAAAMFFVCVDDVLRGGHSRNLVQARREACARLYVDPGLSSTEVGAAMGIDHSTVLGHLEKAGVARRQFPGVVKAAKAAKAAAGSRAARRAA